MSFRQKVVLLISLAFITRFVGLNWGNGYFFHPDENNMASAISQLNSQNLNPHFFAYGQFPLYLGYFSLKTIGLPNTFANSIFILRAYSSIFSIISLFFFDKIYPHLSFVLLLIFTPGLIQLAHFGTTESLLVLTFAINLYLAKLILIKPKFWYFFLASLSTGVAIATKISGAYFTIPIIMAAIKIRSWAFVPFGVLSILMGIILSPYNLLTYADFLSSMRYETGVAVGSIPVFYTTQFQNSIPYLFQITKIFPYINGLPIFIFAILSVPFLRIKDRNYTFIVFVSSIIYFLYFGQIYVKWTRFMAPLFFVLPLFATFFIKRFPKLIFIAIIPGVLFFVHYLYSDIRLSSSKYLISKLPPKSIIVSESGNVIDFPIHSDYFTVKNYDFYDHKPSLLAQYVYDSTYIIVPSRRVYKNYNYHYYKYLFNGKLGFQKLYEFHPLYDFFLNPENAEETWSVFDRPTIRVYKKDIGLPLNLYEKLLQE